MPKWSTGPDPIQLLTPASINVLLCATIIQSTRPAAGRASLQILWWCLHLFMRGRCRSAYTSCGPPSLPSGPQSNQSDCYRMMHVREPAAQWTAYILKEQAVKRQSEFEIVDICCCFPVAKIEGTRHWVPRPGPIWRSLDSEMSIACSIDYPRSQCQLFPLGGWKNVTPDGLVMCTPTHLWVTVRQHTRLALLVPSGWSTGPL